MLHADAFYKPRQPVAGHRIRHDRSAGVILCDNRCHHRNNRIAVYLVAVWQHCRHPVHIGVKDNAKICLVCKHRLTDCLHCLLIFRIRYMIWKMSVRLQKLAA